MFEFNGSLPSGSTCTVTTAQRATGGSEMESSESIRLNSPRSYAAQNRCVTAEDYETLIKKEYPNIRGVKAWGGQDNNPPEYGKVFVSIIPQSGDKLTEVTKTDIIRNILTPKKGLTSTVQLVDPSYLKIQMYSTVYYDSNKTTLDDDPQNNTLRLYYKNSSNEKVIIRRCGSIDYPNGTINIDDIKITALAENELLFTINPLSNDVSSKKNQFIMIDPTLLNITAIPNTTYSEFTHVSSKN